MVSVSLSAAPPHLGHVVLRKAADFLRGLPPVPESSTSSGNLTGSWSSGTGTVPHFGQFIKGIGAPQYLWRDICQSRRRKFTVLFAMPFPARNSTTAVFASSLDMPSN